MKTLFQDLIEILCPIQDSIILTLGHEFRGDDNVGIKLGSAISRMKALSKQLINAYNVPINFLGKIVKHNPQILTRFKKRQV